MTRTITVFLASSEELLNDRNSIHSLIASLDDIYEERGLRIKCKRWEDFPAFCTGTRTQDAYNIIVRKSDICLALFHKKAGKFTIEEFYQAMDEYAKNGEQPQTYAYARVLADGEFEEDDLKRFKEDLFNKMGHFWCNYATDDTMRLHFVMQLERFINKEGISFIDKEQSLKVRNGNILLHGQIVAKYDNLPFASKNSNYCNLKKMIAELEEDIADMHANGENHIRIEKKRIKRDEALQQLADLENDLLVTAQAISDIISSGTPISNRKRLAIEMFEQGNCHKVLEILNENDIATDAKAAIKEKNMGKDMMEAGLKIKEGAEQKLMSLVEEYTIRAKALMTEYDNNNRFEDACRAYERAIELCYELTDKQLALTIFNYTFFLCKNKQYTRCEKYLTKALEIFKQLSEEKPSEFLPYLADTYGNLGMVYSAMYRIPEAENLLKKALSIYKKFAREEFSTRFIYAIECINYNLANIYSYTDRIEEAECLYKEIIEVGGYLEDRNVVSDDQSARLHAINGLCRIYEKTNRSEYAERILVNILESDKESDKKYLTETNITQLSNTTIAYLLEKVETKMNLCNIYVKTSRFEEAEVLYEEALETCNILTKENPVRFLSDIANIQDKLGDLYMKTNRSNEAEKTYLKALVAYKNLAANSPERYQHNVVDIQKNLGILYMKTNRKDKMVDIYRDMLETYKGLAKEEPEKYLPEIANMLSNLGKIYYDTKVYDKAEYMYNEARDTYKRLAKEDSAKYLPKLTTALWGLVYLYAQKQSIKDLEDVYMEMQEAFKELATDNPMEYLPRLAETQRNLGILYAKTQRFEELEKVYEEALVIYKQLAKEEPMRYLPKVAETLNDLCDFHIYTNSTKINSVHIEALNTYTQLVKIDAIKYLPRLAVIQYNLGLNNFNCNRLEEAMNYVTEALKTHEFLVKEVSPRYEDGLIRCKELIEHIKDSTNKPH